MVRSLDHFHPNPCGAPFTVRTFHAAIPLRNIESQLARWLGKMEQHDYIVVHRLGRAYNNTYSLSRLPGEPDCRYSSSKEPV